MNNLTETDDMAGICDTCGTILTCTGTHPRVGVRPALLVCRCDDCKDSLWKEFRPRYQLALVD